MLTKLSSLVSSLSAALTSLESKLSKPLCVVLGLVIGYVGAPLLHVLVDIALIPLKLIGLL